MGDVADILGIQKSKQLSAAEDAIRIMSSSSSSAATQAVTTTHPRRIKKPEGMNRELFRLMGKDALVPSMQSNKIAAYNGLQKKRTSTSKGKWIWTSFTNSGRDDGKQFFHWVKADINYPDYPYAKFNIRNDVVLYTDEEYDKLLDVDVWTRSESDHLMYVCNKYDLRWPIICDRYSISPPKCIEELQARYYFIVSTIYNHRSSNSNSSSTGGSSSSSSSGSTTQTHFSYENEKARRYQLELNFRNIKDETRVKIKDEFNRLTEKKSKKATVKKETNTSSSSSSSGNHTSSEMDTHAMMIHDAIPFQPVPGKPLLQSTRLSSASVENTGLSKSLIKKMSVLLTDMGLPSNPLPTRSVCDLMDQVRRDTIALLSLQNAVSKKEKELLSLRMHAFNQSLPDGFAIPHIAVTTSITDELNHTYLSSLVASSSSSSVAVAVTPCASGLPVASFGSIYTLPVNQAVVKKPSQKRKSNSTSDGATSTASGSNADQAGGSNTTSTDKDAPTDKPPKKKRPRVTKVGPPAATLEPPPAVI